MRGNIHHHHIVPPQKLRRFIQYRRFGKKFRPARLRFCARVIAQGGDPKPAVAIRRKMRLRNPAATDYPDRQPLRLRRSRRLIRQFRRGDAPRRWDRAETVDVLAHVLAASGSDECRMTKDEGMTKPEIPRALSPQSACFVIRASNFIRHSSFGIRHFQPTSGTVFFNLALSTALSTICCPIREISIESGPVTFSPVAMQ